MIDPSNIKTLAIPLVVTVKTGKHPHQAYRANCDCESGEPVEQKNYASHIIAPPRCSVCRESYRLDIRLMMTYEKPKPKEVKRGSR